jgi:hypothetical protein
VITDYLAFDLLVHRTARGLEARVIASPAGEAAAGFVLPDELGSIADSGAEWSTDAVDRAGSALFRHVFTGELLACYRSCLATVRRRGKGLRLRLRFGDAPELARVPWEILKDDGAFLGHSVDTTIVRYTELLDRARPPKLELPLRVLAVLSNPPDPEYDPIDVDRERSNLQRALASLLTTGQVVLDVLEDATYERLHERLQTGSFHIVHFVGHSGVDATGEEGLVVLETSGGHSQTVSASSFRALLAGRDLRLVFLNSCDSARPGRRGPFSGVAQALVQAGVPAVVAMQFPIRDDAAGALVGAFYRGLALSQPVDAALAEARKSVVPFGGVAWATPVVFLRVKDGRVFARPRPPLGKRLLQLSPYGLVTANWVLLVFAVKRVSFYFAEWLHTLSIVGGVAAGLGLLAYFLPVEWAKLVPRLLSKADGTLRPLRVSCSIGLSLAFLAVGLLAEPRVTLEHVLEEDIDSGKQLEIPQTPAAVYARNLCPRELSGGGDAALDDCERRLPPEGFLRLQYFLGFNSAAAYQVRLSLEPAEGVGFADLRTDPAFELATHPSYSDHLDRARTAGNYDLYITSRKDAAGRGLTGTIEIRLLARELYAGQAGPAPRLHAKFSTDVEGGGTVAALTRCWSLLDARRLDCPESSPGGSN